MQLVLVTRNEVALPALEERQGAKAVVFYLEEPAPIEWLCPLMSGMGDGMIMEQCIKRYSDRDRWHR